MSHTQRYLLVFVLAFVILPIKVVANSLNTEAQIYKALFQYGTYDDNTPRTLLISEEPAPLKEVIRPFPAIPEAGIKEQSIPDTLRAYLPATTKTLRSEFIRVLSLHQVISSRDLVAPSNVSIKILSKSEKEEIFKTKSGSWERFKNRYPKARGIVRLSLPAIDIDSQTAIVYLGFSCGPLCGSGSLFVLAQLKDGWRVVNEVQISIS
jgi:hypothetical protein